MDTNIGDNVMYLPPVQQVLRIQPAAYDALLFTFLSIAIIAASARTGFRVWQFRTIEPDDVLLIISTLCLIGGVVAAHENRDLTYLQMSLSLGFIKHPPANIGELMASFQALDHIGGVFSWLSIFIVKLSFLAFFKKLVSRVRYLEPFWWVTLVLVIAGLCVNVGLGFYICPHFGPSILEVCTVEGMTEREGVYLVVSVIMDIMTDLLIICVPIGLLWRVKIDLRRKLGLIAVCSLSTVMIVLALVRSLKASVRSPLSDQIPAATDSTWLFVLLNIEGAVAIVMVSITAFRSMLGQSRNATVVRATQQREKAAAGGTYNNNNDFGDRRDRSSVLTKDGVPTNIPLYSVQVEASQSDSESHGRASHPHAFV